MFLDLKESHNKRTANEWILKILRDGGFANWRRCPRMGQEFLGSPGWQHSKCLIQVRWDSPGGMGL